jgi:hypothetical protein
VNGLTDVIDNCFDAAAGLDRIDTIRIARVATVRALVRERLNELKHADRVVVRYHGALSSLRSVSDSVTVLLVDSSAEPSTINWLESRAIVVEAPDPVSEERRRLRRLLRLLNKIVAIVLRREAVEESLQRIVLRQRSFFMIHGNHPPRLSVWRSLTMPGFSAA